MYTDPVYKGLSVQSCSNVDWKITVIKDGFAPSETWSGEVSSLFGVFVAVWNGCPRTDKSAETVVMASVFVYTLSSEASVRMYSVRCGHDRYHGILYCRSTGSDNEDAGGTVLNFLLVKIHHMLMRRVLLRFGKKM